MSLAVTRRMLSAWSRSAITLIAEPGVRLRANSSHSARIASKFDRMKSAKRMRFRITMSPLRVVVRQRCGCVVCCWHAEHPRGVTNIYDMQPRVNGMTPIAETKSISCAVRRDRSKAERSRYGSSPCLVGKRKSQTRKEKNDGWETGSRTPIERFRAACPTIERSPSKRGRILDATRR